MSAVPRALALLPLLLPAALMAAVTDVELPACKPLEKPIAIDGRLDEWRAIDGRAYQPLRAVLPSEMADERPDLTAELKTAYDDQALYVAVAWRSPVAPGNRSARPEDWHLGGDGIELHLACDGMVTHVLSCPDAGGGAVSLLVRRDGETAWRNLTAAGGAAALAVDAKAWGHELRIPWSALTRTGVLPAGQTLPVMADLAWREITTAGLVKLGDDIRRSSTHFSYDVLTTRERLLSRSYLPSPTDWGILAIADAPLAARREDTVLGAGITALTIGRPVAALRIDGLLADGEWPADALSDHAYARDFLGSRYAMRVGMLADDANLYLAARCTTPDKPLNHQPENTQMGFKGGDCLQIRLARGDRLVNLCTWYDSAAGTMALTADGKDLAHPFLLQHGATGAMAAADGSYTIELAIPWGELFPGPAPKSGDRLRCTLQPWWAGLDPRFTLSGRLAVETRPPLPYRYEMPRDAEVTIGVFTKDGALLRYLTRSEMRKAGANTAWWDGRDQDGRLLVPGDYAIKALYHDPLGLTHQFSVGNPGTPAWPTADGSGDWLGDESNPQAATTDGDWVYLASPGSEYGFNIVAVDGSGQRRWGIKSHDLYPRCVSLAVQGDVLYVVYCGPEKTDTKSHYDGKNADNRVALRCYDKRTGAPARFTRANPSLQVARWPYRENLVGMWEFFNHKTFDPDTYGGLPRYGECQFGEVAEAMGVAATADAVWIAFHTQGVVRAFDPETGAALPARDIPLEKPVSLLARPDGTLLAVSGKQVVRIDPATKAVTPLITGGLSAPFGVAAGKDGSIYVSDWRDSFQVKVFSPDGKPLRAIGKPGGRAVLGAWDKTGMLLPRGLAVTDAGRLWVAEDDNTPRRVSVWDAASGAFIRDYIGPTPYGGGSSFWFEPGDQTVLHTMGCRFKLDWAKKTWTPEASELRRMSHDQPFTQCGASGMSHGVRTIRREGRDYAVVPSGYDTIVVYLRQGDIWRAVAAAGTVHRWSTDDGTGVYAWDSDVGKHMVRNFRPECFRGHSGDNFAWSDRDNDGQVQAGEMTWFRSLQRGDTFKPGAQPEFLLAWGLGCGPDFDLALGGICKVEGGDNITLHRLAPHGWTAAGVPLYDIARTTFLASGDRFNGVYADTHGNVFAAGFEDTDADALSCFDQQGRKLWRIAGKAKPQSRDVAASNVIGEMDLPGIGAAVGTWAWHANQRAFLIAADGLYIGTVQPDTLSGPEALCGESWRFWYQAPDGTPYLINGGNQSQHILKVTGLEKSGRFAGKLTISAADAALAAAATPAGTTTAAAKPISMQWRSAPPAVDGDLADWNLGYGAEIALGQGRNATAVVARDAANLHLAWLVEDDSPNRNQGGNWQTLFVTGDCVDLMLATDPKADPRRSAAAAGDLRLVLGMNQGRPVAVLYRPVAPMDAKPVQLMAARFDRIDLLEKAVVAARPAGYGYAVEVSLPLSALGIDPASDVLRGDLGVVSSDLAGRDRVRRSYHFNRTTTLVNDLTTEATLQPAAWGALRFPLGANLLRDGGFEDGLCAHPEDGWSVVALGDGMKVTTGADGAHSGARGLLLRQVAPVAGGGATVAQRVPVRAGSTYRLRCFLRGAGLGAGNHVQVSLAWQGAGGEAVAAALAADAPWSADGQGQTLTAPAGASAALVSIRAAVAAPGSLPVVAADDVEFVESH